MAVEYNGFQIKEKISDMIGYGYNVIRGFPKREGQLKSQLTKSMLTLYRLATKIPYLAQRDKRIEAVMELDAELAILKHFVRFAHDIKFYDRITPPLSKTGYNHWEGMLSEIGGMIGNYLKALNPQIKENFQQMWDVPKYKYSRGNVSSHGDRIVPFNVDPNAIANTTNLLNNNLGTNK